MSPSSATVEDDQDLDDLDDFLPSFAPSKVVAPSTSSHPADAPQPTAGPSRLHPPSTASNARLDLANSNDTRKDFDHADGQDDEDEELDEEAFEAELARGMESLLKGLGVSEPPSAEGGVGGSKETRNRTRVTGDEGNDVDEGEGEVTEADRALERLFAKLMSGQDPGSDPFAALMGSASQSQPAPPKSKSQSQRTTPPRSKSNRTKPNAAPGARADSNGGGGGNMSLDETIRRTMENLKTSEADARTAPAQSTDPLSALLASLSSLSPEDLSTLASQTPGASGLDMDALKNLGGLAGLGGTGGEEEDGDGDASGLGGMLDGMMKQLMTREILEEPLQELGEKFPAYLTTHSKTLPKVELERYLAQQTIVNRILVIFGASGYSDDDERSRKEISDLMARMQDLGSPPDEIMGDMPEGFDSENGGCSIM